MHLDLFEVLSALTGLFLLIAAGYAAVRLNVLPASASSTLSRLLMQITVPCTVFTSLLRPYDPSFLRSILIVLALGALLFPLNAVLSLFPLSRLCRVGEGRRGMWSFCATFCNNGFMGFPIALALFGEEGLALAAVLNLPFNLLIYTMGAGMICMDRPAGSRERLDLRSVLFTGINAAAVLGLIAYFCRLSVPDALLSPLTHLSNVTTPLSMFVTGMNLTGSRLGGLFRDRDTLTACAARLVALPLVSFAVLWGLDALFSIGPLIFGVVFIIMAMPAPAAATLLSETYGLNREFAAGIVFLSSLFCMLTIPAMAMLI